MKWYETITLTRIFLSYPYQIVYSNVGHMINPSSSPWLDNQCRMDFKADLCAGVIGGQTLSKFILSYGITLYIIFTFLSPLMSYVLRKMYHLVYRACCHVYSKILEFQPGLKYKKKSHSVHS